MEPNVEQTNMGPVSAPLFQPSDRIDQATKQKYWDAAVGLQTVDNLSASKYLESLIAKHVEGTMKYQELETELHNYYNSITEYTPDKEADMVAISIYAILADESPFTLDIDTLKKYHQFLFRDLDPTFFHPGEFRIVNITKKEPILGGDTVRYEDFNNLEASLQSVINFEKSIYYLSMNAQQKATHFADFTAKLWRVHPFREGNTRATATFIQKHAKSIHLQVDNSLFKNNALYFRLALVRANYNNPSRGLPINTQYLINFFENLLFGANHPLDPETLKH